MYALILVAYTNKYRAFTELYLYLSPVAHSKSSYLTHSNAAKRCAEMAPEKGSRVWCSLAAAAPWHTP